MKYAVFVLLILVGVFIGAKYSTLPLKVLNTVGI